MSEKILIALTNTDKYDKIPKKTGYWLSELAHFYAPLKKAGYMMDYVTPKGGRASLDENSIKMSKDKVSQEFLHNQSEQERLAETKAPADINPNDYVAIYYPGGHGPMWDIAKDEAIGQIAARIYANGGIVAAVCHGSAGLLAIKKENGEPLIKNKKVTSFTNTEEILIGKAKAVPFLLEDALKAQGAKYQKRFPFIVTHCIVDDRIVTGQNPKAAKQVAAETLKLLREKHGEPQQSM